MFPYVNPTPGPIVLFGSGETSPNGQKIFDRILRQLPHAPQVALLETPAGFELNSNQVIGRIGEFISIRLQNYAPQVTVIPARRRGGLPQASTDDPQVAAPLLNANLVFMGPGSPSYAVRQLRDSLVWQITLARHRLGAAIALASAATIAVSVHALPIYEIYKVGEDLHWKPGLDLFGMYGLPIVFVPHWNNNDGGEELDTSRCFMGQERFARLMEMLPPDLTVIGLDEKTALVMDFETCEGQVIGLGGVTLLHTGPTHPGPGTPEDLSGTGLNEVAGQRSGHVHIFCDGASFPLSRIGNFHFPETGEGLPTEVWQQALAAEQRRAQPPAPATPVGPPPEVLALVEERAAARLRKEWAASDQIRDQIAALGWQVVDTKDGQRLEKIVP